ncbi:unnamed protein product [Schistocephalus solidus]|uniref:Uncharacterized protein n=1 Tax=Schistocephalus solidus TaxID=70667 RepID=A0A183TSL2_SCHSO|nr:unnamed protein product [Schistocephalus solidus]
MKLAHRVREPLRTAKFLHDFPQSVAIPRVKVFCQIHEAGERRKSCRLFRGVVESQIGFSGAVPAYKGEGLPGDVEQRDASVVITELSVPLPLVEMDDGRVFEILRIVCLASHLLKYWATNELLPPSIIYQVFVAERSPIVNGTQWSRSALGLVIEPRQQPHSG